MTSGSLVEASSCSEEVSFSSVCFVMVSLVSSDVLFGIEELPVLALVGLPVSSAPAYDGLPGLPGLRLLALNCGGDVGLSWCLEVASTLPALALGRCLGGTEDGGVTDPAAGGGDGGKLIGS